MLFVLWLFQALFFKMSYGKMKKLEVERLGDKIISKYPGVGDKEYDAYLEETAYNNGLKIVVFRAKEEYEGCEAGDVKFKAEYISSQFNAGNFNDSELGDSRVIDGWENFYSRIKNTDKCCFTENTKHGTYLFYGARLDDSGGYLYMTTPVQALDSTVSIMNNQLLFSSIVCLLLSIIVSYFISSRITKPIAEFSRVARKLGEGDYTVRFEGSGYTEIDNLAETLNYATDEIGKTEQMRRDFLANVSHDLRTPLTMVKAYAEMIRDISGSDKVKRSQHSQVIIDEADRLTGLVNDILNLSKLQSGTETLTLTSVDMVSLVRTVFERCDIYASRDGYVFELIADGECAAVGDYKRLEQVIYNLVGNAISYTGESKKVCVSVKDCGEKIRVSVRDFGAGIAPEELDKVWERYYRANQNRRNVVGSGLGLSIVKSILVSHGARYGVTSTLGEGTEFWFELDSASDYIPASAAELPEGKRKKKKKERA